MQITESQYKKWLNLSKIICSNDQIAQDILQDLLLNFLEKEVSEDKINDNYVFISLKNRFLTYLNKESKTRDEFNSAIYQVEDETDIKALEEQDEENKLMLESIKEVLASLRSYEQKLWTLHHMYDLSQRHIARETGITHVAINKRINNIKEKIKLVYNGKKEKIKSNP
jgi:RNA polymerase sigma factor (sigma-70 family)